ncbi:hypothetical protein [Chitinophaga barathri]|uniref:Uncharacterized protein n=1 Tax=Chitinophaga barathri TaxID=1647451 RepID=A0A3N4M6A7_9BACT|nr:hypothetical protein [Chitinophaga barathri]RPD38771.1 hypothetical protein EG028_24005 [Chitinophaga barathri]
MKHVYLLLLTAGLLAAGCTKEKVVVVEEVPYKPYESPEEKALGINYSLVGRWVITGDVMQDGHGMGADRWTFTADSTYSRLYLGDIGESGSFRTIFTMGNDVVRFELSRDPYNTKSDVLIKKKSYRHILVDGVNFFREQ